MKLNEHLKEQSKLVTDQAQLPKGVLARVTYPIMRFGVKNANERIYEREVGNVVLNDPDIKNKLATRTLFGDCEHPEFTQVKLDPDKTSHLISNIYVGHDTEYAQKSGIAEAAEEGNTLYADFDILPTKPGKFIYILLEAGSQVGVSTRAEGDLTEEVDAVGSKTFKVVPTSFKMSTTDFTGDPSTENAMPEKIIKAVAKEYENKFIDSEVALALLRNISTKEAKQLRESIKCKEQKILNEVKEIIKPSPKSIKILAESIVEVNGKKGIVNQVFESTGKALVQVGIERKVVSLSECRLVEEKDTVVKESIKKGFYKTDAGEEVYVNSDDVGNGKVCLVTEKGEEYVTVAEFMKMVEEKKILLDEKKLKEDGHDDYVEPAPAEGSIQEDDPSANGRGPSPEVTEPEADGDDAQDGAEEGKGISDFDTMEDMYDYVIQDVPALKDYDQEEVIKGLIHEQNHNEGEYDILFNDVHKLANIVCTELSEVPDYYTRLEGMIDNAKEDQPDEEIESGNSAEDDQSDVHPVDPQLFTPGMDEAVKQINHTRVSEAILKAEKETLVEMASNAIAEIRTKYLDDICGLTERIEATKKLTEDIEILKGRIDAAVKAETSLNEKLVLKESELTVLNKKLVELQDTATARAEDVTSLNERLEEAKKIYEKNIIDEKIKTMAKVTGLKIDERTLALLRECKTDDQLVTKLEDCRDQIARSMLHSNIVTEVKIKASSPGNKNLMLESIGPLLDSMSGNGAVLQEST